MVVKEKTEFDEKLDMELIEAAKNGDLDKCEELIKSGARVDARYVNGLTALDYAVREGHAEIAELLISAIPAESKLKDIYIFL